MFKSRLAVAVKRREIMNLISIETVIGQRLLCGVNRETPRNQRVKIAMILRYKYTVKKAKKNLKLRVDRLQAMTGIIYEPLFTRKTLLSNKLYNILSPNILL